MIARHGLSASKALGQNFLLDEQLLDRIARVPGELDGRAGLRGRPRPRRADPRAAPGRRAGDRDRAGPPLPAALAELSRSRRGRLRVIEGDALAIDGAPSRRGAHIVANLPYNVGTALLVRWLGGEDGRPGGSR